MDGQLVQVFGPSDSFLESVPLVEIPHQEWVELCARIQRLERENLELRQRVERENLEFRQQIGYWKSRHRDALLRIAALEQKIEHLEGEKRQLQADLFGRRSETKPLRDRSNHLDDPQADSQRPKRKRGQQAENHGPQRRDYSRLPVRERFLDLPPSNVSARIAVNRYVSEAIPKTPSKSRSRCVPTGSSFNGRRFASR